MKTVEILLVEDNPGDIRLMREVLNEGRFSYNLSVVSDGVAAMAFVRHESPYGNAPHPELILLDLNLPLKNGLEVLEEIKADNTLNHIRILLLSSLEDIGMFDTHNLQADGFVSKPTDLSKFDQVIAAIQKLGFNMLHE